jgi:hypothetical protein
LNLKRSSRVSVRTSSSTKTILTFIQKQRPTISQKFDADAMCCVISDDVTRMAQPLSSSSTNTLKSPMPEKAMGTVFSKLTGMGPENSERFELLLLWLQSPAEIQLNRMTNFPRRQLNTTSGQNSAASGVATA